MTNQAGGGTVSEKRRFRVTIEGTVGKIFRSEDAAVPEVGMRASVRFTSGDNVFGQTQMVSADTRIVAVEELPPLLSDKERADRAEKVLRTLYADYGGSSAEPGFSSWSRYVAEHIGRRAEEAGIDLSGPPG